MNRNIFVIRNEFIPVLLYLAFMSTGTSFTIPLETTPYWSSAAVPSNASLWGTFLADITNDGYPEVILVGEDMPCYLFSNDSGVIDTVSTWQSIDADRTIWASFGDYDNDGDLDMAAANYYVMGGRTKLYRNDNGTLTSTPIWTAVSGGGACCDWGDVDNDGDLDLAIADMYAYPSVYYNNNGVLETNSSWTATDYNVDWCNAWIDVDNDGDLDLAVGAISLAPLLRVYYNNNGTLEQTASWLSQLYTHCASGIAAGDLNKDGWLDVGVSTGFGATAQTTVVFMNLNDSLEGNPSWISDDATESGAGLFGDVNGDGYLDWAVNNGNAVCYENNAGNLSTYYTWISSVGSSPSLGIDLGDVDQDGIKYKEDTLVADGSKKLLYLSTLPIHRLTGITINGDSISVSDYCCNPRSGWVSFKDSIPAGSQVIFKYCYSIDMELLLSDYNGHLAYLFRNTNNNINERLSQELSGSWQIYPNPFCDRVEIKYSPLDARSLENERKQHFSESAGRMSENQQSAINIYDATGRIVKLFALSRVLSALSITWDGTDESGTKVPAGIYFVQIGNPGTRGKTGQKIIKLE